MPRLKTDGTPIPPPGTFIARRNKQICARPRKRISTLLVAYSAFRCFIRCSIEASLAYENSTRKTKSSTPGEQKHVVVFFGWHGQGAGRKWTFRLWGTPSTPCFCVSRSIKVAGRVGYYLLYRRSYTIVLRTMVKRFSPNGVMISTINPVRNDPDVSDEGIHIPPPLLLCLHRPYRPEP